LSKFVTQKHRKKTALFVEAQLLLLEKVTPYDFWRYIIKSITHYTLLPCIKCVCPDGVIMQGHHIYGYYYLAYNDIERNYHFECRAFGTSNQGK